MKDETTQAVEPAVAPELAERRYVYNGGSQTAEFDALPRGNRPVKKRRRSPFNVVLLLVGVSVVIVFYVWNKISVNRLVSELAALDAQYQSIVHVNESLRAEITKKSNLERIERIANGQLGLVSPSTQPVWFSFDDQRLSRLDQ